MNDTPIIPRKEANSYEEPLLSEDSYQFVQKAYNLGLDLLPLNGKAPIEKGWTTRPRLTSEQIKKYFKPRTHNIGIRTGRVSGVVVVDLDSPEAIQWAKEHLPSTPMATQTGKRTDGCPVGVDGRCSFPRLRRLRLSHVWSYCGRAW